MDPKTIEIGDELQGVMERAAGFLMGNMRKAAMQVLDLAPTPSPDAPAPVLRMAQAIRHCRLALVADDLHEAWMAIDAPEVQRTVRDWDRMRFRDVPSEEEVEQHRQELIESLRAALRKPRPPSSEFPNW